MASSESLVIVIFFLLQYFFCEAVGITTAPPPPENGTVGRSRGTSSAVFVFGDSTLDTGNNDHIVTFSKSNFSSLWKGFSGKNPHR
ncbi:unnamed protein product [Linum tenue]|uniref:GDSL esterase/lipase n=1 Tax=Linum tenue TaxID=586396 RepID=A0AAV0IPV9_9ROSI|nr:unnamed protein product [Linum tenue]